MDSFEERVKNVIQWLNEISVENISCNGAEEQNGSSFLSIDCLFEQNSKTLEALEELARINREADANSQRGLLEMRQLLEKSQTGAGEYLRRVVSENFRTSFRRLQLDGTSAGNLRLLTKLISNAVIYDGRKSEESVDLDSVLISLSTGFIRNAIKFDHRRVVLAKDCQYLQDKLNELLEGKRELDEHFERNRKEKFNVDAVKAQQQNELAFLRTKSERYTKAGSALQHELYNVRGFDAEKLSRGNFTKQQRRNEELSKELQKLKKELQRYRDLPPNMEMAQSKLAESKRELSALKKQVLEKFND